MRCLSERPKSDGSITAVIWDLSLTLRTVSIGTVTMCFHAGPAEAAGWWDLSGCPETVYITDPLEEDLVAGGGGL